MAAPQWLARFNKHVTNRITGPLAPNLPGFGVVIHPGRKSQRTYRTPVNVFPRAGGSPNRASSTTRSASRYHRRSALYSV